MILGDRDLRYYLEKGWIKISPFSEEIVRENGVDLRIGSQFARLRRNNKVFSSSEKIEDFYETINSNEIVI